MFKFNLGDEVQSLVSGFKGVIVGRAEYLNGCLQYDVVGRVKKDGKVPSIWIDEESLEIITALKVKVKKSPTGGPQNTPTRSTPDGR